MILSLKKQWHWHQYPGLKWSTRWLLAACLCVCVCVCCLYLFRLPTTALSAQKCWLHVVTDNIKKHRQGSIYHYVVQSTNFDLSRAVRAVAFRSSLLVTIEILADPNKASSCWEIPSTMPKKTSQLLNRPSDPARGQPLIQAVLEMSQHLHGQFRDWPGKKFVFEHHFWLQKTETPGWSIGINYIH